MDIYLKLDTDFENKITELKLKYPELADINGLSNSQLNHTDFIDNFIDEDVVANSSIDGNSNVSHKDMVTLEREMMKPHKKLLAFNKIYYEIKKEYGKQDADKWLENEYIGLSYMHDGDTSSLKHYCFAYTLKDVAEKGLFFEPNRKESPAKHLITFVDFIKEFVSFTSNLSSGAVGLPDLIPYMFYFWKKDCENGYYVKSPEYHAKQNFQRFIYAINQSACRDGMQSAFTNTSVFDRPYFEALFGGSQFPDGTYMIDYEEEIIEFQKWYMETMSDIRSQNMFTFPVSTISLIRKDGKFADEEFAEWAIKHNMKWSDSNLFIDKDVTSLSNCPLAPDVYVDCLVNDAHTTITATITMEQAYQYYMNGFKIQMFNYPTFDPVVCKINKFDEPANYLIQFENGEKIQTTANHMNKVYRTSDYVLTKNLTTDDYLPFVNGEDIDWVRIKKISVVETTENVAYCAEILEDNAVPLFILNNGLVTHNCRLKSNIENLGYFNSLGSTALKVGSVKVSTINLARIALDSNTEEEYIENLKERLDINFKALDRVRHIIERNVEKGLLPNFDYGLVDFEHLYNTCGFLGVYETMKKFGYVKQDELGNNYYTDDAKRFGEVIFDTIHQCSKDFIEKYNCNYQINTEQIPGETAADKLMKKDKYFYPNANIYDLPLYGNQFIPLGIKATLQERVMEQALFDKFCNGGSILHANIDAPFNSYEKARYMTEYIADAGVTYFAFNTKIQTCKDNHAFYGKNCPVCGKPASAEYCRIAGFYTKISTWSDKRQEEYKLRRWENVNDSKKYS